ncbi:MAG: hypothetical protein ACT4P6_01195 [Gemmatimonadaceae bacterium]
MHRPIAGVALFGILVACGGGSSGGSSGASAGAAPGPPQQTQRRDPNVITRAEIEQAVGATTARDLVQRLRPAYLRESGPMTLSGANQSAMVRVNDQEFPDLRQLRQIPVSTVQEIRYYSASDATAKFGGRLGRPVIAVTIK